MKTLDHFFIDKMPDDSEDTCAVCFDGGWTDSNQILYCDGCDVAVHQKVSGDEVGREGTRSVLSANAANATPRHHGHATDPPPHPPFPTPQQCYGVTKIPPGDEPYFCDFCIKHKGKPAPRCEICGTSGNKAVKRVEGGTGWAHVTCALAFSSVNFASLRNMGPVLVGDLPTASQCKFCKDMSGACLQCQVSPASC